MENIPVTLENQYIGMRVKRGRDWDWGDQDRGGLGTIIRLGMEGNKWCQVEWDNDEENDYRVGENGRFDLYAHNDWVQSKNIPEGRWIVSAGTSGQERTAIIWNVPRKNGRHVGLNHALDVTTDYSLCRSSPVRIATPSEIHKVTKELNETNISLPKVDNDFEEIEI